MRLLRMCPDCDGVIAYNSHFKAFMHGDQTDCAYMEDINGERIWDNEMRDRQLKQKADENDDDQLTFF